MTTPLHSNRTLRSTALAGVAVALALCGAVGLGAPVAAAQEWLPTEGGARASRPAPGLERIQVNEQLDQALPLDLAFRDHTGRTVHLRDYFEAGKPVLLSFAYHTCPTLCSMVLDATSRGIQQAEWTPGVEYTAVTISIDPDDTVEQAARKRAELLATLGKPEAERGWHFLVGDQDAIDAATEAAGYRYFYNANQDQYAHPAAIMFLTPEGRFARYLYGLEFNPADFRLALLEASEGRSISTTEHFLLYCYAYDASANTYTVMAMNVMKLGGLITVFLLGGFLTFFWRRERRRDPSGSARSEDQDSKSVRVALDAQPNQVRTS
ncbi:MAG: SCO family protein [Sandaracinaceae bacterium]|nr:SCO family protein [Sandaracinaceae bacterium]